MASAIYNCVVVDGDKDDLFFVSDGSSLVGCGVPFFPRQLSEFFNDNIEALSIVDSVDATFLSDGSVALVNPNAETGSISGWTVETGSLGVRQASPSPHSGSYYFFAGTDAICLARQRVDLVSLFSSIASPIDAGIASCVLSWYQASYDAASDPGCMGLRFLDASLSTISTSMATSLYVSPSLTWVQRSVSVSIPVLTRYVDILISGTRTSGTNNDSYYDDIVFSVS